MFESKTRPLEGSDTRPRQAHLSIDFQIRRLVLARSPSNSVSGIARRHGLSQVTAKSRFSEIGANNPIILNGTRHSTSADTGTGVDDPTTNAVRFTAKS